MTVDRDVQFKNLIHKQYKYIKDKDNILLLTNILSYATIKLTKGVAACSWAVSPNLV